MNGAVGPIFNEKVVEKWNLWVREQCTDALFTAENSTVAALLQNAWKKKKKERNVKIKRRRSNSPLQKGTSAIFVTNCFTPIYFLYIWVTFFFPDIFIFYYLSNIYIYMYK